MMARAVILLFSLSDEAYAALSAVLQDAGIHAKRIPDESLSLKLSALIRGELPSEPYTGEPLAEPMAVLCNFGGKALDRALDVMRKSGIRIPLKAVCTPINQNWTPVYLQKHLQAERRAMTGRA